MNPESIIYGEDSPLESEVSIVGRSPIMPGTTRGTVTLLMGRPPAKRTDKDALVIHGGPVRIGRVITIDPWNHFSADQQTRMSKIIPEFVLAEGASANDLKS